MDQWKPGTPVIPKDDLVEVFHGWDRTKDKSKTKSFNRAKEWISKLLMCPSPELPDHQKMRKIDTINAFEHMLESSRSGASLEDYIKSAMKEPKRDLPQTSGSGSQDPNRVDENPLPTPVGTHSTQEIKTNVTDVDNKNGVAKEDEMSLTADAGAVSITPVLDSETKGSKRPPVCRLSWKAKECVDKDCQRSHPPLCKEPRCWDFDEDLPFWKSSGCVNWHGRQKSQKRRKKPKTSATSLKPPVTKKHKESLPKMQSKPKGEWNRQGRQKPQSKSSGQKPISSTLKPPMTKKSKGNLQKVPSQKPKPKPFHGSQLQPKGSIQPQPKPQAEWNWHQAGNDQAAWPPLTRSGIMEWGNGKMPYNVAAQGPSRQRPTQLEFLQNQVQNLTQLVNQVLQA